jgi:hypothetical protein
MRGWRERAPTNFTQAYATKGSSGDAAHVIGAGGFDANAESIRFICLYDNRQHRDASRQSPGRSSMV